MPSVTRRLKGALVPQRPTHPTHVDVLANGASRGKASDLRQLFGLALTDPYASATVAHVERDAYVHSLAPEALWRKIMAARCDAGQLGEHPSSRRIPTFPRPNPAPPDWPYYGRILTLGRHLPVDFHVPQIAEPSALAAWLQSPARLDRRHPESNWCGLCCVQAVLRAHGRATPSLQTMFDGAVRYGVYRRQSDGAYTGAYHAALVDYMRGEFQLEAHAQRGLTGHAICRLIDRDFFLIASVNPALRYRHNEPLFRQGGHLVLIYGYSVNRDGWWIHYQDSTGWPDYRDGIGARATLDRFAAFFSGNAILVPTDLQTPGSRADCK